ncbi:MAG: NAD(P)-dependent glycerol-3-phosphate dehydrogenase [Aestuariivirgaceae bacterium]|nr:NAD(P)-dependent glycerol-3-phosphate dehydrogenase [Aestuariivirgaceae bacterium]
MRPAIIGAGSWGTALAITAARACGNATLFAHDAAKAADMQATRENSSRLAGIRLEDGITVTADPEMLRDADCLLIATPAQSLRSLMTVLSPFIARGTPALIAAKGIERGTHLFMSDVLRQAAPHAEPVCLSGPSFARDVATGLPTAVTLAGPSLDHAAEIASALSTPSFRIYASEDLRGAEIGGAVKNVLAIACGIAQGLGLGDSARAALTTRGFAELMRAGAALGGKPATLLGLSGLGDLLLTCASTQSRNFSLGLRLGEGLDPADPSGAVTEGAWTAPVILEMAREQNIEMPVVEAVARVLDGTSTPRDEVTRLLSRPLKSES